MNRNQIENRLINLSVETIKLTNTFEMTYANQHLSRQLIRSTSSSALNYAESHFAESRKDFIHKIKIALKELRESMVCLDIIIKSNLNNSKLSNTLTKELNELIAILVTTVNTTIKNSR